MSLAVLAISDPPSSGTAWINTPYCGQLSLQTPWYQQFNLDPLVIGFLVLAGLWAGLARGPRRPVRIVAVVLAAALWISPFCAASASLLSVRAVHHLAVMLGLAPILALSGPASPTSHPLLYRSSVWALVSAGSFAIWFWPPAYTAAWNYNAIYWALQLGMLGAAFLFWRALFQLVDSGFGMAALPACAISLSTMGVVGAVLTFAPQVLLAEHQITAVTMGIAPLADQQLAGLMVWLFGMVPIAAFAMRAGWSMLSSPEGAQA
jgi:putative membrane protein